MDFAEKLQHVERLLLSNQSKVAQPLIEELIHAQPSNVEVWYWRGVCERIEGEFDLAENDFRNVVHHMPSHERAFYGLGLILESKGELKDAIIAYQQAATLGHKQAVNKLVELKASHPIEQQVLEFNATQKPPIHKIPPHEELLQKTSEQGIGSTIELRSEKGIDYSRLRDLLAAGNWKQSDLETEKLMCKAVGRKKLNIQDIENFPCTDLRTINQLWMYYSGGRFGFSVQKQIYKTAQGLVAPNGYNSQTWESFGQRICWHQRQSLRGGGYTITLLGHSKLNFEIGAPLGHLPAAWILPRKNVGVNTSDGILSFLFVFFLGFFGFPIAAAYFFPSTPVAPIVGFIIGNIMWIQYASTLKLKKNQERITIERMMVALFVRAEFCGL